MKLREVLDVIDAKVNLSIYQARSSGLEYAVIPKLDNVLYTELKWVDIHKYLNFEVTSMTSAYDATNGKMSIYIRKEGK